MTPCEPFEIPSRTFSEWTEVILLSRFRPVVEGRGTPFGRLSG